MALYGTAMLLTVSGTAALLSAAALAAWPSAGDATGPGRQLYQKLRGLTHDASDHT